MIYVHIMLAYVNIMMYVHIMLALCEHDDICAHNVSIM